MSAVVWMAPKDSDAKVKSGRWNLRIRSRNLSISERATSECASVRPAPPSIERRRRSKGDHHKYQIMRQYTSEKDSK